MEVNMKQFSILFGLAVILLLATSDQVRAKSKSRQQTVVIGVSEEQQAQSNPQAKLRVVKEFRTPLGGLVKYLSNGKRVYTHLPILTSAVYGKLPVGGLMVDDYIISVPNSNHRFLVRILIQKTFNPRKPKIGMRKNLVLAETKVGGVVFITSKGAQGYYPIRLIRGKAYKNLQPGEFIIDDFCMSSSACLRQGKIKITKPKALNALPKVEEIKSVTVG